MRLLKERVPVISLLDKFFDQILNNNHASIIIAVYAFVERFIRDEDNLFTYQEIAKQLNLSITDITYAVNFLEKIGYLTNNEMDS